MEDLRRLIGGRKNRKKEDRISQLPDELIHHILSFVDSYSAVQTCVLSKRWVSLWSTLPHLDFGYFVRNGEVYYHKFVTNFLSKRNQLSDTFTIHISSLNELFTRMIVDYAISHNVKHLYVCNANFDKNLSFPVLETLHLLGCGVPLMDWSLPCLKTLYLDYCNIKGMPLNFEGFNKLEDLSLLSGNHCYMEELVISSPNVTHLFIAENNSYMPPTTKYVITAPKLSWFRLCAWRVPVLSVKYGFPCVKEVEFDITIYESNWKEYSKEEKKQAMLKLISLFGEFPGTKFLRPSFGTIQVLSWILNNIRCQPSPFVNLKYLTLGGYVPGTTNPTKSANDVIKYLIKVSPGLKIFVKEYKEDSNCRFRRYNPRHDMLFSWNFGLRVIRTRENRASKKHATSNVEVKGEVISRGLGVIPPATVHSEVKGQTCSYGKDDSLSLWEGHRVYSDYVDLLTYIKIKHPETFEHFAPRTCIINTMGLNTLCSSVRALCEISRPSFTASTITYYRELFTDLGKWGFNTTWLLNLLSNADEFNPVDT